MSSQTRTWKKLVRAKQADTLKCTRFQGKWTLSALVYKTCKNVSEFTKLINKQNYEPFTTRLGFLSVNTFPCQPGKVTVQPLSLKPRAASPEAVSDSKFWTKKSSRCFYIQMVFGTFQITRITNMGSHITEIMMKCSQTGGRLNIKSGRVGMFLISLLAHHYH